MEMVLTILVVQINLGKETLQLFYVYVWFAGN